MSKTLRNHYYPILFVVVLLIRCHELLVVADGNEALLVSPCPDVLSYSETNPDSWTAHIRLTTDHQLRGVWLQLSLDKKANSLLNWFGHVNSVNNREFSIRNADYILPAGVQLPVKIRVLHNAAEAAPLVQTVRLNGFLICGTNISLERATRKPLTSTTVSFSSSEWTKGTSRPPPVFLGDFSVFGRAPEASKPPKIETIRCGVAAKRATPLITSGQPSREGAWPWHVALYVLDGLQLTYSCGGSLVSNVHVITAAHCVAQPNTALASSPESFIIHLGRTHLQRFERGAQQRHLDAIRIHPDFNATYYHNDVAVLRLAKAVEYTDYVRPVCLWSSGDDNIVDQLGTVVGWGYDARHVITDTLQEIQMPVVDLLRCIYSNPDVYNRFTSVNNFCAGFKNGTSVCNGDSGGGMFFERVDPQGGMRWELRGLVSVSLVLQQRYCDPFSYTVFTDVLKFRDWITKSMQ